MAFETMVQRAIAAAEAPPEQFVNDVLSRLREIEGRALAETDIDELEKIVGDAEQQGQLRAYACPSAEIQMEGLLHIDRMEEWGTPKTAIEKLKRSTLERLASGPEVARSALRAVFEEYDSWVGYTDEYEESMSSTAWWLLGALGGLIILSSASFFWPMFSFLGIICAGGAGSCISILSRMPVLEVEPTGVHQAYTRRILSRVATGVGASTIGCGLLGWGVLSFSVHGQTFADLLCACTMGAPCSALRSIVLLGIPILFGFSERALISLDNRFIK